VSQVSRCGLCRGCDLSDRSRQRHRSERDQNWCRHSNDWSVRSSREGSCRWCQAIIQQHGDTVAGQKIELIIRDDAGVPDNGKRLTQELIVKERVSFLGAGITPTAMAMAPLVTEGKVATVVMISGTSVVTERSPYYVRTSFTLGQQSGIIADWAIQNGSKKAVCILSDWAPGTEAGKVFEQHFTKGGGQVLDTLRVPLANPDFAPFLQRARSSARYAVRVRAGRTNRNARQAIRRTWPG
jgi:ABC-type branched-subunit amino acid transport system substrate-binding protein